MPGAKHKSDFEITTDTTYLALTGDLWGVCCEEFVKTWLSYNGTTLYTVKLWYCNMKRVLRGFDSHVVKTCQKLISEPWPGHTNGHSLVLSARLLHSPRLVAVGLSAGGMAHAYGSCDWLIYIDWGLPHIQCIMDSHERWEFPLFCKGHWQSPCTALTAGLVLCKETVKESARVLVDYSHLV